MLVGAGDWQSSSSEISWKGNALALLSAIGYAAYSLAIKLWLPEEGVQPCNGSEEVGGGGGAAAAVMGSSSAPPAHKPVVSMLVFFGFLGLWTCFGLSPIIFTLHVTRIEDVSGWWRGADGGGAIKLVIIKGLFDNVLSDLLWAKAIQYTSPTLAAVGLSLTIPLALLADLALDSTYPTPLGGMGALFIFAGFVCCTLGEKKCRGKV